MITLKKEVLDPIYEHALNDYPKECCGILIGLPDDNVSVHPCTNIQDRLHQKDPVMYPRNAKVAYYIDPAEQFRIISEAENKGFSVQGFYHSHPDHPAYFSDEDTARALFDGEPAYPDAVYVVVSVIKRTIHDVKVFAYNEQKLAFQEQPFQI